MRKTLFSMNLFITGTDTGVGKTYVVSLLLRTLRNCQIDAVGMKPIETGEGDDAQHLHVAAGGNASLQLVNPIRLKAPLAPAVAAEKEGKPICLKKVFDSYRQLSAAHSLVLIEGAGGWRVPISREYDMANLAKDLSQIAPLQVLIVALNRLGAINHTLLTIESIRAHGLSCAGFILNQGRAQPISDASTGTNAQWVIYGSQASFWFEIQSDQTLPLNLTGNFGDWISENCG